MTKTQFCSIDFDNMMYEKNKFSTKFLLLFFSWILAYFLSILLILSNIEI